MVYPSAGKSGEIRQAGHGKNAKGVLPKSGVA